MCGRAEGVGDFFQSSAPIIQATVATDPRFVAPAKVSFPPTLTITIEGRSVLSILTGANLRLLERSHARLEPGHTLGKFLHNQC